jgi:hypothetical protein
MKRQLNQFPLCEADMPQDPSIVTPSADLVGASAIPPRPQRSVDSAPAEQSAGVNARLPLGAPVLDLDADAPIAPIGSTDNTPLTPEQQRAHDEEEQRRAAARARAREFSRLSQAAADRATDFRAVGDAIRLRRAEEPAAAPVQNKIVPVWLVGDVSAFDRKKHEFGELEWARQHGSFAKSNRRLSTGLLVSAGIVGCAFTLAPAASSVAFLLLLASGASMAVGALKRRMDKQKMEQVVDQTARFSTQDDPTEASLDKLAKDLPSLPTSSFEFAVAKTAFKQRLAEMRANGETPNLAVRQVASRMKI